MKTLRVIYYIVLITKGIFGFSSLLGIYFIFLAPMVNENYVNYSQFTYSLNDPYFKIVDENLQYTLASSLPSNSEISLTIGKIDFQIPINPGYKIATISIIIFFSSIILLLLHILQNMVKSIVNGKSFSTENIVRLKRIGLLISLSPVVEYVIESISLWWIKTSYSLQGLTAVNDTKLGFFVFLIGLVIYTIAFAFDQGHKLKTEQDLTI